MRYDRVAPRNRPGSSKPEGRIPFGVFLLVAVLLLSPAVFGGNLPRPEPPARDDQTSAISSLVLTFDPPQSEGAFRGTAMAGFLEELLAKGEKPTFHDVVLSKGGLWRIMESPDSVQLGVFFPPPASEAEELASVLLKHLVVRMRTFEPGKASPTLRDFLLAWGRSTMGDSLPGPGRATLWLAGPISGARKRLTETVGQLSFPDRPLSLYPGSSGEIVLSNEPPTALRLAIWNRLDGDALVSARFIGEAFLRDASEGYRGNYEVWASGRRVILALVATGTLEDLSQREKRLDEFLKAPQETASPTTWRMFSDGFVGITRADQRDLEKGAFISAWAEHLGVEGVFSASHTLILPDEVLRGVSLPGETGHRSMFQCQKNPSLGAVFRAGGSGLFDVAVGIQAPESSGILSSLARKIEEAVEKEFPGAACRLLPDGVMLIHVMGDQGSLPAILSTLRNLVQRILLGEIDSSGKPLLRSDDMKRMRFACVGVGKMPPYAMLSLLRHAWPTHGQETPGELPLTEELLARVLGVHSTDRNVIQGRLAIGMASTSGLSNLLAHLMSLGVNPEKLRERIPDFAPTGF